MQTVSCIKRILCGALLCLLLLLHASATDRASLFIRDGAWENDSLLPFIEADGKKLLPVSAFGAFEQLTLTESATLGSLLIESEDGFLSYNLNFGTCLSEDGTVKGTAIYRYGGELYLAPEPICEKFGLSFETMYASDGYLAARLTDGSETLAFGELLSLYVDSQKQALPYLYNPTGRTVGGVFMYPVLPLPAVANIGDLLALLERHPMTFAISPKDITQYAGVVPAIYAAGHTLVYYMNSADLSAPAEYLAAMESANRYLFALLGKTVRVYVSTENLLEMPVFDGYYKKSCPMILVADDLRNDRIVRITLYESPTYGIYNFALASDRETRFFYNDFLKKFDAISELRSMPMTEASPEQ